MKWKGTVLLIMLLALSVIVMPFAYAFDGRAHVFIDSVQRSPLIDSGQVSPAEHPGDIPGIVPGKILVKYKKGTPQAKMQSQAAAFSAKSTKRYERAGIASLEVSEDSDVFQLIRQLEQDPNVEYAEPVYIYKADGVGAASPSSIDTVVQSVYANDPYIDKQWGLDAIRIQDAWNKVSSEKREDVTIAILDTGVKLDHADLKESIVSGINVLDKNSAPEDDHGHGTHVAGIAAAIANNGKGIAGVAGGAKIMPVKVLSAKGEGDTEGLIEAIYWAADNGADIINLSLSRPKYLIDNKGNYVKDENGNFIDTASKLEYEAIQYAVDKGVVVVGAAGNESNHYGHGDPRSLDDPKWNLPLITSPVGYPASYDNVIAVGAVNNNAEHDIADFSNIGPELDVVAPGVHIWSTFNDGAYKELMGTSQAVPMVSGLAALLLAADGSLRAEPGDTAWKVQRILEESAIDQGAPGNDKYYGAGLIDGTNAFTMPRLRIDRLSGNANQSVVSLDVSVTDYEGTVVDSVYDSAPLSVYRFDTAKKEWQEIKSVTVNIAGGRGTATIPLNDAGLFTVEADKQQWIGADIVFSMKPAAPVASLSPGTYRGSQTVTLRSASSGAKIYYTLDGANPTESSSVYNGPLTIKSSGTLKAIAVKDGLVSDVASYSYTIEKKSSGGGGGGFFIPPATDNGGATGSGFVHKTVSKDDAGKTVLKATVSDEELLKRITADSGTLEITIDASSDEPAETLEIAMSSNVLKAASDHNKTLMIKSNLVQFVLRPGAIAAGDDSAEVKWVVKTMSPATDQLYNIAAEGKWASPLFDFGLSVGSRTVTRFNMPLTVTLALDRSASLDMNKVGIYYFNESASQWDYIGGKTNTDSTITFETDHFSKYAAVEFDKTFADIRNHWARYDIEVMASKQIAKGISADKFAPDAPIKRAEFAALLSRALKLQQQADKRFADVDAWAWYYDSVAKAYAAGIISGMNETSFAPGAPITREQMASMMVRAYAYATGKKPEELYTATGIKYKDEEAASDWAISSIRSAGAIGLMSGNPDGSFVPQQYATRAQAVSVIKRLLEKTGQ